MSGEIKIDAGYQIPGDGNSPVTVAMLNLLIPGIIAQIVEGAITARELADGSISAAKLSADINAQLSAGLADGAVTEPKLAAAAVSATKIAAGAVDVSKLAPGQGWLPGMYVSYPATALTGFLRCEGQAVSRTTYAALFAVVGTTFGVGDGSTTFNLPDARGGVAYYAGDPGVTDVLAKALGQVFGPDKHKHGVTGAVGNTTLTQAQLPASLTNLTLKQPLAGGGPLAGGYPNYATAYGTATGVEITNPGGGQPHNHDKGTLDTDQQTHLPRGQVIGYLFIKT
jgi:microcystin-dependent protein